MAQRTPSRWNTAAGAIRTPVVAVLSLVFTYLFFLEYLPPVRRVRLPFDLPAFHYPFLDYAFQALRQGRFPEWDPTIYCGMPFAANVQAALFYPGTWLAFLGSFGRDHLSYQALEDVVFLHVWLAFLLCYIWLVRRVSPFAAACGAGVFAYGGYLLLSLQHYGVVAAYAWIPFGMAAVDEFSEQRQWRCLWKVSVASCFAFLAGYTPTWAVAVSCFVGYALFRRRGLPVFLATAGAVVVSMLLSMVQLLPSLQLSSMREAEVRYGIGLREPAFFLSYLVPNYWDFALSTDVHANPGREYLYLGAPGLLGLVLVVLLRRKKENVWTAAPLAALFVAAAVVVTNPANMVWDVIQHSTLLAQVIRDFYFLAGLSVAAAPLAAIGIDRLVNRLGESQCATISSVIPYGLCLALVAWCGRLLYAWRWETLEKGSSSAWNATVAVVLFGVGLVVLSRTSDFARTALAALLLLTAGVDYKAHGTYKRFDATREDPSYKSGELPQLNTAVYQQMRANNVYRVAVDLTAPFPQMLRHYGLATPQGFDPFLTTSYKSLAESLTSFRSNWEFDLSANRRDALDAFGVRYFLTTDQGPNYQTLTASPDFRLLEPANTYYKAFEFIDAKPPYGWVRDRNQAGMQAIRWQPELRELHVTTPSAAALYLTEQWHPGWKVWIDGVPAPLDRYPADPRMGAFQSVVVPAGEHVVVFRFADPGLRTGAWVSVLTLAGMVTACRRRQETNG